jgi:hypothetical protein
MFPYLDAAKEPVFAQLATDPRFSATANELLQPRVYTTRHDTFAGMAGLECTACIPHKINFLAGEAAGRTTEVKVGVVVADRRAVAKSHGPQGRGKRRGSSAH